MEDKQYIYLRFTDTKSTLSWLISTWTRQWPTHVELVLDDGIYFSSDIENGVAYVDDLFYENSNLNRIEYYKIEVTEYEKDQIIKPILNQLGKKYDILALIGNMFERNWQELDKWFCSELISYGFEKGGKMLIRNKTNRITPGDLLLSPLLKPCKKEDIIFK